MASVFDKYLTTNKYQQQRDASPVMSAIFQRRQPTYDEIKEQERLNREAGVTLPRFQGSLKAGQALRNIGGLTYVVEGDGGNMAPSEQTAPTPRGMDLFEEALSLPDEPAPPTYQGSMPERRPMQPPVRSDQGLFTPPQPQMQPPTIDTTIDDLMSQLQGYGRPPTMPDFDKPAQRDLGLPSFTTPGFAPPGLMTPNQPQIPSGSMPPAVPDMFRGQMPMPTPTEYIPQSAMQDIGNEDIQQPTEAELDALYKRLIGDNN